MPKRSSIALAVILSAVVYSSQADAQQLYVGGFATSYNDSAPQVYNMYNGTASGSASAFNPSATATVDAQSSSTAAYGLLTANALATIYGPLASSSIDNSASATGEAEFIDSFLLTSSTLATGTPVEVTIGYSLGTTGNGLAELSSNRFQPNLAYEGPGPSYQTQYLNFVYDVGETFTIDFDLMAHNDVQGGDGDSSSNKINDSLTDDLGADILATANVSIDVENPAVSYTSSSGTIYSTTLPSGTVPEPSSLALFAIALMAIAGTLTLKREQH
jgi:hypothetical protein